MTAIDLTLGEHTIPCRGVSSDQKLPTGLAESGQAEVECGFNTAAVTGECTGTQLMPMYANGDHALSAVVTTDDGETRTTLAS